MTILLIILAAICGGFVGAKIALRKRQERWHLTALELTVHKRMGESFAACERDVRELAYKTGMRITCHIDSGASFVCYPHDLSIKRFKE